MKKHDRPTNDDDLTIDDLRAEDRHQDDLKRQRRQRRQLKQQALTAALST